MTKCRDVSHPINRLHPKLNNECSTTKLILQTPICKLSASYAKWCPRESFMEPAFFTKRRYLCSTYVYMSCTIHFPSCEALSSGWIEILSYYAWKESFEMLSISCMTQGKCVKGFFCAHLKVSQFSPRNGTFHNVLSFKGSNPVLIINDWKPF